MPLPRNNILAMLTSFFMSAGCAVSSIYSSTLFLTTYPAKWLVYFMGIQAIITMLVNIGITQLFIKNIKFYTLLLTILCIVSIFLTILMASISAYFIPFFMAILMGVVTSVITITGWSLIPFAFGLREYKKAVIYINKTATMGAIIGSFHIPILLNFFSLNSLLISVILMISLFGISAYFLPTIKESTLNKRLSFSPSDYPLYLNFLIYFVCLIAMLVLIDYLFKYELANQLSKEEIGKFMAYFMGITNVLSLISAASISKRFLQMFNIKGLLYVNPGYILLSTILVAINPTLWSICILASSRQLFFYNHNRLGLELVLNILPPSVRTASKVQLQSVVLPGVTVMVFILLWTVSNFITLREIAISIVFISLICLFYVTKISTAYKKTLQEDIEFKRFDLVEEIKPISSINFSHLKKHTKKLLKNIANTNGVAKEQLFLELIQNSDIYLKLVIVKEAFYYASRNDVSDEFKEEAKNKALNDTYFIFYLGNLVKQFTASHVVAEINSRIKFIKKRCLLWLAIATEPQAIYRLISPLLFDPNSIAYQRARAKALELLDISMANSELKNCIIGMLEGEEYSSQSLTDIPPLSDSWLNQVILTVTHPEEIQNMDVLQKVFNLRAAEIFKDLSSETLMAIAEETEEISFNAGDIIFSENDIPDGLYLINSGKVNIIHHDKLLTTLKDHDLFGEIALLDEGLRTASAIAATDCSLLFVDKSTFDRVTDDLPDVLRGIIKVILRYLRQNMV